MKKQDKNTKQRLFEMMSKLDKTFKPRLNEDVMSGHTEDEETNDFLRKIKSENPEMLTKFVNLVKRRGLDIAKTEYEPYDKEKQKELAIQKKNDRHSQIAKKHFNELVQPLKGRFSMDNIKNIIKRYEFGGGYIEPNDAGALKLITILYNQIDVYEDDDLVDTVDELIKNPNNKNMLITTLEEVLGFKIPHFKNFGDNETIIALYTPQFPTIGDVMGDGYFEKYNISQYKNIPNYILKGTRGNWLDMGSIYDDKILNNDKYQKITVNSLNDSSIINGLRKLLSIYKKTEDPDNYENVDYNFYNQFI